jgi:superfamily II DNA/RNA helicase
VKRLAIGRFGAEVTADGPSWESLRLPAPWDQVISTLEPGARPRDVQVKALQDGRALRDRRNLVVTAPTNGGKTLVGLLVLLEAVARGRRAILLEPLRALAQEKASQLQGRAKALGAVMGVPLHVSIATGDYRIEQETFRSPPPGAELLVATPERLEAILRNSEHDGWLATVDAVCIDEAHLLASPRRGPVLEYLTTALLHQPSPPRVVLASATLGGTEQLARWLEPCDVLSADLRRPPMTLEVCEVEAHETADGAVLMLAEEALRVDGTNVLVFVYQTRSAEALARRLREGLGPLTVEAGPLAYHSQMSREQRASVHAAFTGGRSRCVVTTTALALGVNLPVTHVIIRDTLFPGEGELEPSELLQMAGRAGRGEVEGRAAVILHLPERRTADALASQLARAPLPEIRSHFLPPGGRAAPRTAEVAERVAAFLARRGQQGATAQDVVTFFGRSLAGPDSGPPVRGALNWLLDPDRLLAWKDEHQVVRLTVLGLAATQSTFPLPAAAGCARLLRDLMELDSDDRVLEAWKPLDSLLLLDLVTDRAPRIRRFSADLVDTVDAWMEANATHAPILFGRWIRGAEGHSKADEVLGSLGVGAEGIGSGSPLRGEPARRVAYSATARAIVLFELGRGRAVERLTHDWKLEMLEGVEERWRDDVLWLLSGFASILEVRAFFHHLRERCSAGPDRILRVKQCLRAMRHQALELRETVEYCSPLGAVLRSLRRVNASRARTVGVRTIRRLEAAGVSSLQQLMGMGPEDLRSLGVRAEFVAQLQEYMLRRGG